MEFMQQPSIFSFKHAWWIDFDYSTEDLEFCWRGQLESDSPMYYPQGSVKEAKYGSSRCATKLVFCSDKEYSEDPSISGSDVIIVSSKVEITKVIAEAITDFMWELKAYSPISEEDIMCKSVNMSQKALDMLEKAENARFCQMYCNPN